MENTEKNYVEVTRVTTEKIEVSPCIECGSTNIRFLGEWDTMLAPVKNPKAYCYECGYAPEIGDNKFKDPYEHYQFWNEMNNPKNQVELLVAKINKLRSDAEDLDWKLVKLASRFPELINEEYSFGRLLSGKDKNEVNKK